jgi:hypothetical protein
MTYIHELSEWPRLTWDFDALAKQLAAVRRQGQFIGRMRALGFPSRRRQSSRP